MDSDGEEAAQEGSGSNRTKRSGGASGAEITLESNKPAISEASSDGEMVEIPDQDSDTAHKSAETASS